MPSRRAPPPPRKSSWALSQPRSRRIRARVSAKRVLFFLEARAISVSLLHCRYRSFFCHLECRLLTDFTLCVIFHAVKGWLKKMKSTRAVWLGIFCLVALGTVQGLALADLPYSLEYARRDPDGYRHLTWIGRWRAHHASAPI